MITLLPPNASSFERAVDTAGAARLALPSSLAGASWNPDTCPAALLGYLAYQLSLDLWDDSWPETKKRQLCRDALRLHRLKTTLAGIRAHVAIADADLVKVVRPPSKLFATAGMTADQRESWLQSLRQIRLYPYDLRPIGSRRLFLSTSRRTSWFVRAYPRPSRGIELSSTRATLWDGGAEQEIGITYPAAGSMRLVIPRVTPRPFLGHATYLGRLFATTSEGAKGVVTLDVSGDIAGWAVAAGLNPVSVEPTRVASPRVAPAARGFFGNRRGRWTLATAAPRLVYDRVCLADPTRIGARRGGRVFMGHARLGYRPYRAELLVRVPMRRNPWRAARFAGSGFLAGADTSAVTRALRAVSVSKAARDTILVDTALHRDVSFGDGLQFDDFTFGQIRKVA